MKTVVGVKTFPELKAAVRLAKASGKKFSLLLNQPCFGPKYDEALGAAAEPDREGLGACIVRELPMLEKLNALKLRAKLTVSSLALCFNLPAPEEALAAAAAFEGKLILAMPLLTEAGLAAVKKILRAFGGKRRLEVIANDLGLMEFLRGNYKGAVEISCGRILTHRVRIMPGEYAEKFLARYGVKTFEVDDASVLERLKLFGLALSWHYPFRYATVTRFCPWEDRWSSSCGRSAWAAWSR